MDRDQEPAETASGQLLHNLILFGRLLHQLGISVNPGRMITVVQALGHIEIGRRSEFYHALRCLLVRHKEELPLFDEAFRLFWRKPAEAQGEIPALAQVTRRRKKETLVMPPPLKSQDSETDMDEASESNEPPVTVVEVTKTFSAREILRNKEFSELEPDEIEAVKEMMANMIWQLGSRRTRRQRPGRGRALDMRRSLRQSLRHGGEIMIWSRRKPKQRPRPLIVIADISGSMERYSRLLLHFIYSLARGLEQSVEAFVFSTRLTRITRPLRDRNIDLAMRQISSAVPDWSGGTRIGEAIKHFNYDWARRVLGRGAVVLLISDGWDRGDPNLLDREMDRLKRSCHRLIWLNPLLGSPEYEPLTRGMQAALPHIDDFLPVHNVVSLEDLAHHLSRLDDRRTRRRKALLRQSRTGLAHYA